MISNELVKKLSFEKVCEGEETEVKKPFCCDLLSIAMSKAPAHGAWVTVMGNINTIAVATLADVSVIVLAEGVKLDEVALAKAKEEKLWVLESKLPIYETAKKIEEVLCG